MQPQKLSIMKDTLAICRLDRDARLPQWALGSSFYSCTRTDSELSIVCLQEGVPADVLCEKGWRCLKVDGPLDFSLTGILTSLAAPLSAAGISILLFLLMIRIIYCLRRNNWIQQSVPSSSMATILSDVSAWY